MARSSRKLLMVRIALPLVLVILCGYVVSQRSAARVGVDELTFIPRLGEGFLCVGTCRDKPGVLILSSLSRRRVAIHADTEPLFRRTTLIVERKGRVESHRLERPAVVLIDDRGPARLVPVDWDAAAFPAILRAVHCDRELDSSAQRPNCGRPFTELMDFLREHQPGRIPPELDAFTRDYPDK